MQFRAILSVAIVLIIGFSPPTQGADKKSVGPTNEPLKIMVAADLEITDSFNEPTIAFYEAWRAEEPTLPELLIYPPPRLIQTIRSSADYCAFGWSIKSLTEAGSFPATDLIESDFFRTNYIFVLENENLPKVTKLSQLEGKLLYTPYADEFSRVFSDHSFQFKRVPHYDSLAKMYLLKRTDYILFEWPIMKPIFEVLGIEIPRKEDRLEVFLSRDGMTCHRSRDSARIIESLNLFIDKTRLNGRLAEILGDLAYVRK